MKGSRILGVWIFLGLLLGVGRLWGAAGDTWRVVSAVNRYGQDTMAIYPARGFYANYEGFALPYGTDPDSTANNLHFRAPFFEEYGPGHVYGNTWAMYFFMHMPLSWKTDLPDVIRDKIAEEGVTDNALKLLVSVQQVQLPSRPICFLPHFVTSPTAPYRQANYGDTKYFNAFLVPPDLPAGTPPPPPDPNPIGFTNHSANYQAYVHCESPDPVNVFSSAPLLVAGIAYNKSVYSYVSWLETQPAGPDIRYAVVTLHMFVEDYDKIRPAIDVILASVVPRHDAILIDAAVFRPIRDEDPLKPLRTLIDKALRENGRAQADIVDEKNPAYGRGKQRVPAPGGSSAGGGSSPSSGGSVKRSPAANAASAAPIDNAKSPVTQADLTVLVNPKASNTAIARVSTARIEGILKEANVNKGRITIKTAKGTSKRVLKPQERKHLQAILAKRKAAQSGNARRAVTRKGKNISIKSITKRIGT